MIRFSCLLTATALLAGAGEAQEAPPDPPLALQQPPGAAMSAAEVAQTGSLGWMQAQSDFALEFRDVGQITLAPGGVIAVDPLTWSQAADLPWIEVPAGTARFLLALDRDEASVSKALLVFSDAAPTCGDDVATILVDTGLAGFFDRSMAAAVTRSAGILGPEKDLYNGWFDTMIGEVWVVGHILPLPDNTLIPIASSGWGDGGYPVARLRSATGETVALYADFMGKNAEGDWLLPPDCGTS
ncbi:DUF4241 domain-containing protein [Pseudomonas sp. GX19020]|uniref:DUF4241 domain-containing protein n=1 Tax=Pseudomonas sp. GX19020 TaxID=2942277 RepID=UPI002018BD6F|nr:DUF4241 domain-containing protein [Pseudomonas sp. GX19020]MCL4065599.1 DUF4241 domain-containing protein [Pseudomonas sp. GX19020]